MKKRIIIVTAVFTCMVSLIALYTIGDRHSVSDHLTKPVDADFVTHHELAEQGPGVDFCGGDCARKHQSIGAVLRDEKALGGKQKKAEILQAELARTKPIEEWFSKFKKASASLDEGTQLAKSRAPLMRDLMRVDPKSAYDVAIAEDAWNNLPQEVQKHVARRFSGKGRFEVTVDCESSIAKRQVTMNGFSTNDASFTPELSKVRHYSGEITGVALGNNIAVVAMADGSDAPADDSVPEIAYANSTGNFPVLWLNIKYSDQTSYPATIAQAESVLSNSVTKFATWSYGRLNMTYDIVQVSIPSALGVSDSQVAIESQAAAEAQGYRISDYSVRMYRTTNIGNYAGLRSSYVYIKKNDISTAMHELGHCMGLYHANFWKINAGQPSWGEGINQLYAEDWDAMSNSPRGDFNAYEKKALGWLDVGTDYATNVTSGVYRIYPYDSHSGNFDSTGVDGAHYAVSVFKDTAATHGEYSDRRYSLSFRNQPEKSDRSCNKWWQQGLLLHFEPWTRNGSSGYNENGAYGSTLVDAHPHTTTLISAKEQYDSAIYIGETYVDNDPGNRDGTIYITPLRKVDPDWIPRNGDEYIDVKIVIGDQTGNQPPTGSLVADKLFVTPGETVTFQANATDPDDTVLAYHWDFGLPPTATNIARKNLNGSPTQTYSWPSVGTYNVTVTVSDCRGGSVQLTQPITVGNLYTVTFDLGTNGTRSGGGDLVQTVIGGASATAPTVEPNAGYVFFRWDKDFSNITADTTVYAEYRSATNQAPTVDATADSPVDLVTVDRLWTPGDIATVAWYDSTDPGTGYASGDPVGQWNDKSGNNNHATQATAARRPTYTAADPMVNNMPSIGNPGTTGSIGLDTPSISAKTIYLVTYYKDGIDPAFDGYSTLLSGPGSWGEFRVMGNVDTADFIGSYAFNDAGTYKNGSGSNSVTNILPMPATILKLKSSAVRTQVFGLGYNKDNNSRDWQGALCEVIFTDGTEDLATQKKIEGYLAHKWGLEANLPTEHLYRDGAPKVTGTFAESNLNGTVVDPEGDPVDITWTLVSTDPAGLTADIDNASVEDTVARFTAPGTYTFRLTADDGLASNSQEVTIIVNPPGGNPIADVDLPAGISLYGYTGQNPIDAQAAFQTLIDNDQLSLLRWVDPSSGGIKELYYTTFPSAGWVNEIGDLTLGQGYVVKTTAACTLSITGNKDTGTVTHDLPAGYSIIGFNKETPVDAQAAVQSLIDAGKFELMRWVDPSSGAIKELYFTTFPSAGWVNEIGNLIEGQGYIIKLNAPYAGFMIP